MTNYADTKLRTNKDATKVEQKLSRTFRADIIATCAEAIGEALVVDNKTYVQGPFKDRVVTVELSAVVKGLDFTV